MREIIFRGQMIDKKKRVYGDKVSGHKQVWVVTPHEVEEKKHYDEYWELSCHAYYQVDPSTVGQYSGKDDKNSVRIFEDDIVKLGNNPIHNGVLVRYIYADWRCGFVYEFLTGKNKGKFTDMNDSWRDYERIGNIHDNPELLEVEK